MAKIELMGVQGKNWFLFRYPDPTRYIDDIPAHSGFIYRKDIDKRYPDALIGSILAHNPYWNDAKGNELPDEEIERIADMEVSS